VARSSRTYARDARGRFASTPGGGSRKPTGGLPKRQPRKTGSPPPKRRGLVTQRAAVRRSAAKLRGKDPADQSLSGTLSRRAQKGAVTRAQNRLAAAEQSGRRRVRAAAQPGIVRPGRQGRVKPVAATPASRPAVRGRQRLQMYATGKDGVVLKKALDAIRNNPFGKGPGNPNYRSQNEADKKARFANGAIAKQIAEGKGASVEFKSNQSSSVASYDQRTGKIQINRSHPYWQDPLTGGKDSRRKREWSSASPLAPNYHEIGHGRDKKRLASFTLLARLVAGKDPEAQSYESIANSISQNAKIARRVSRYAASSPAEFVAETFAGLRTGQRYDREVMKLYRELMGSGDPALKARWSRRPRRKR